MTPKGAAGVLFAVLLAAVVWLAPGGAGAQSGERIVTFDSEVWVHGDASLTVVETIAVESRGRKIKRGIYRDFPTSYRDRYGNRVRVGFEVVRVLRDGQPEPHFTEALSNGVRLYLGDEDVFLPDGRHVYSITYRTDRQLGFFDDFDELYWNVTGTDWDFEIGRASATVHPPEGARVLDVAAYAGKAGSQEQAALHDFRAGGVVYFETTRPLAPGEGLTVAVSWPSGFVARPSEAEQAAYFLSDNAVLLAGVAGVGLLLVYYLIVWHRVGRDPEEGPVVAQYAPPKGVSPAAARYITQMDFDEKVFTSAIVGLAVKGYLTIREGLDKVYTLEKTGERANLMPGEKALARKLFWGRGKTIELKQANHKRLQKAKKALQTSLRNDFEKIYFVRNRDRFIPGLVLSVLALAGLVLVADQPAVAAFMCVWLSGWSVGVYFLVRQVWKTWRVTLATGSLASGVQAVLMTAFSAPFVGGEAMGIAFFAEAASIQGAVVLAGILLINFVFYHLLKAPTLAGRRMMDQIEGFAEYLSVAEKDRMNLLNPPERTPELFEKFLPYALALGVEQAWSEQFSEVLARAGQSSDSGGHGYSPRWYHGRHGFTGGRDLTSALGGAFAGSVAAASTSPGSSSGSGGGGSVGGGGGGGGGGGW
jgi:hypothetical protein